MNATTGNWQTIAVNNVCSLASEISLQIQRASKEGWAGARGGYMDAMSDIYSIA